MNALAAELPSITASAYSSSALAGERLLMGHAGALSPRRIIDDSWQKAQAIFTNTAATTLSPEKDKTSMASTLRLVKVFIADPNENLPLGKRMVFTGEETFTDLNDQELFFEVPIANLLATHNELRKTTIDKSQSEKFGRDVFLEPVRIRDLKMVVVTLAAF